MYTDKLQRLKCWTILKQTIINFINYILLLFTIFLFFSLLFFSRFSFFWVSFELLQFFSLYSLLFPPFLTFSLFFIFTTLLFPLVILVIVPPPLNSLNTPSNDLYSPQVESTSQNDQWPLKEEFTNAFDIFRGSGWRMRVSPVRRARTVSAHPTSKRTGLYTTGIIFNNVFFSFFFLISSFHKKIIKNKQKNSKIVLPI